ncbi:hypothetical protein ASE59_02790 [Sphingomonas sp. Leaf10]|nr:hypothetical protein ASE59_02790 [Sphingomonas sp. Leaf10]
MLGLSVAGLAWSLRWFWIVLKPREYEYPSSDAQVQQYGRDMLSYHAASGVTESDLDARTVRELRLFMMEQYGNAAAANLVHNATKLKARSKTLFFMLTAFVLAFACEATIFLHRQFGETSAVEGSRTDESENTERHPDGQTQPGKSIASTPDAAPAAVSQGRREFLGRKFATGNQEQAVTRDRPNTSTPKPGSAAPMRPTPPSPIVVMKDRAVDLGNTKTQPKPTTKPDHR